tara:strand:- start:1146 stop:2471 length:1326 start_codon:yes stop_codon:yes gene_type:complete
MKFNNFLPIIFIEVYLVITLIIFVFGPVNYYIEFPLLFWGYILVYHAAMIMGYFLGTKININFSKKKILNNQMSLSTVKIIIALAAISSVVSMKQFTLGQLLNPFFLYESVVEGLLNPGEAYTNKMVLVQENVSNKAFNALLFTIAFTKIICIPVVVLNWGRLSTLFKFFAIFATILPVLSAISNGTNKSIFDFFIYYFASLLAILVYNRVNVGTFRISDYKFFSNMILVSFFGAFIFFGLTIGQRGGSVAYLIDTSTLSHISLNNYDENYDKYGYFWYVYTWFSNYLVQGYYGFALSLGMDFDSTFGFGNSVFLMRQFEFLTGIDLSLLTYQNKIDPFWDEYSQWHSFYAHFANDFHFAGVTLVSFVLGYFIARVWIRFLHYSDLISYLLIPVLFLLVVFIPANNQVFGLLDTFSTFFFLFILWVIGGRKINFFNRKNNV